MDDPIQAATADVSTGHEDADPGARIGSGRAMALSFLLTAVFDVGLALVVFAVARHLGASNTVAYLVSGVGPVIMLVITWVRARTLSGASVIVLVVLVLSAVATLIGGTDARLLLAKDSLITGGFGVACLLSLLFPRPLMYYFGAKFATDGTKEGLGYWSNLWQYPGFRRSQYLITILWGLGYVIEGVLRVAIVYGVSNFATANTISVILPWVFLAALITVTVSIGRRTRAAALARRASAAPA